MSYNVYFTLITFLKEDDLSEKHAILEHEQAVLLSDTVDLELTKLIEEDKLLGNKERATYSEIHRKLLRNARRMGISGAWSEFERDLIMLLATRNDPVVSFTAWLQIFNPRDGCDFLEAHPELFDPSADAVIEEQIAQVERKAIKALSLKEATSIIGMMRERLALLRDIRKEGASPEAIRVAFVDRFGGLALKIPPWLEEVEQQLDELGESRRTLPKVMMLLLDAVRQTMLDRDVAPEVLAELQRKLAEAAEEDIYDEQLVKLAVDMYTAALRVYTSHRYPRRYAAIQTQLGSLYFRMKTGNRQENQEQAIVCFKNVLQVCTPITSPYEWAVTQHNLGLAYHERLAGDRRENLEQAIAYHQAALQVRTREAYPWEWAETQFNLGNVYNKRIDGEKQENLDQAIAHYKAALEVHTLPRFRVDFGNSQNNLGNAYRARIKGERAENLEAAITCYNAALQVRTRQASPIAWAETQFNLAEAYLERIEGKREDNLEAAIACYEATLQVYTPKDFPTDWAISQRRLGKAYHERIKGERRSNLEKAIQCYLAESQVYLPESAPAEWASVQNGLGNLYFERLEGSRRENLERAIAHYQAALQVYTQEDFPVEWAGTQNDLGRVYSERIEGEHWKNLERAIACYEATLRVFTETAFPFDWAMVQFNLGSRYGDRIAGERWQNLEQAITYCEAALRVFTRNEFPLKWGQVENLLGVIYANRLVKERRENQERAISYHEAALQVFTRESAPDDWARAHADLAEIYRERLEGKRLANLEEAIAHNEAALQVYVPQTFPIEWANVHNNLGSAYCERIGGDREENLEQAIAHYQATLQVFSEATFPPNWASIQINLGNAYRQRIKEDKNTNQEQAIVCYQGALQVYQKETFPEKYAMAQVNLGSTYANRIAGERRENLQQAANCFRMGLQVVTRDAYPDRHREVQLILAETEMQLGQWENAHKAYASALDAEDALVRLGAGAVGRDIILKGHHDAALRDCFALTRLERIEEAIITVERGRARGLAEAIALNTADPARISDPDRRERYVKAHQAYIAAQRALNDPISSQLPEGERRRISLARSEAFRKANEAFEAIIAEIRAAQDPADFLNTPLDAATILRAAAIGGPGHALVYIMATPWGGVSVAALSANPTRATPARFARFDLPRLTSARLLGLIGLVQEERDMQILGGFAYAQRGGSFFTLTKDWHSLTFREWTSALSMISEEVGRPSMMNVAALAMLVLPEVARVSDVPLNELSADEQRTIAATFDHLHLRLELQHCFEILSNEIMRPLIAWLQEQGVVSLTLIPCGQLAAFPLTAVPLADERTVSETLPTSVAPSARSLLQEKQSSPAIERQGVYALGDPRPTHQELRWGEAEAFTLAKLAQTLELGGHVKVQTNATRSWLIQGLQQGLVVDASCHGQFDTNDFRQSALLLARAERLSLGELLSHEVDLRDLRLLALSACETAVLDLSGAVNEVRSLAAGVLQSGAKAVLASLWSVDDRATYLLMIRFAQEWFPRIEKEAPAAALARAQHWLRTVTNRELEEWEAMSIPRLTEEDRREAGAESTASRTNVKRELETVRGRGYRYTVGEAQELLHTAVKRNDPGACPYADSIYWAGFQIMGW